MLQIQHIKKEYRTGTLVQKALDDVSLNLRDNEFVAILGPSGSGKTTLLNIIGGLDRYDSGDLIINGISTKKYKDRDWDSYRNHTIGFVFQSYNLIPHQTVLANVELALTISGVSKEVRAKKQSRHLKRSVLENSSTSGRARCPAVRCSVSPSPALLSMTRKFCLPMSRPARSIPTPVFRSWTCCRKLPKNALSSWSHTIRSSPSFTPTGSSPCVTV